MYTLYISGAVCGQFITLSAAESRARRARALHPRDLSTVTIWVKTPTGAYVRF